MEELNFTGEYFVPGKTVRRIEEDHLARYEFASTLVDRKSVLDIACGVGYSAPLLLEKGAISYKGVDINEGLVEYATQHYSSKNAQFLVGDIILFRDKTQYDFITCFETIEHVASYKNALRNLYTLLNPKGLLLISSPNRLVTSPLARYLSDKPVNKFHTQEFTISELIHELKEAGFSVDHRVYGQRLKPFFYKYPFFRKFYNLFFKNKNGSPAVTIVNTEVPRYFLLLAYKPQ